VPDAVPLPLSHGLLAAEMAMNLQLALGERRYLLLHAASVERAGRALILTGESGSGKSTLSALLMAIAIRCKTFKEAQANATVVVLGISLLPLMTLFNQEGTAPWHRWVPALSQTMLMGRVLKGEVLTAMDIGVPVAVCLLLTAAAVAFVSRALRNAALK